MSSFRRVRGIRYLVYLLFVAAAALALYLLVPAGVVQALRAAYVTGDVNDLP